jgi:hypothetical protein
VGAPFRGPGYPAVMSTRVIVTSQPTVACDVCERSLLRGEQPDIFLAAGRRLTVCELCAPRAAHEGWIRESENPPLSLPPMRSRRGRSFLDRLPAPFRARQLARPEAAERPLPAQSAGEEHPYDFLDVPARAGAEPVPAQPFDGRSEAFEAVAEAGDIDEQRPVSVLERATQIFNASEYPRRIAGVARSLGAPEVNVRSAEHLASVVVIVVAWELCWYRYEVDLSEAEVDVRVLAQGTELSELAREERIVNAVAGESGALALTAA